MDQETSYVYAKVLNKTGRYVRVENPADGATIRVSGDDHLLRKTESGAWLLMSHEFLETAVLANDAGVHMDESDDFVDGFFDKQIFGMAIGNFFAFVTAVGVIGGMVLWSHHWH
jgi:hypothetical protein